MGIVGSVPPLTVQQVREHMRQNSARRSYVYVGGEGDAGWGIARECVENMAALDVWRAETPASLGDWIDVSAGPGAVFGWGDDLKKVLTTAQAADFDSTFDAIAEADLMTGARLGCVVLVVLALLGCGNLRQVPADSTKVPLTAPSVIKGVSVSTAEVVGADEKYNIPPRHTTGVWVADLDSILVVTFDDGLSLAEATSEEDAAAWDVVTEGMKSLAIVARSLRDTHEELNLVPGDSLEKEALEAYRVRVDEQNATIKKLRIDLDARLGKERREEIWKGQFPGAPEPGTRRLANLASWLELEFQRLIEKSSARYSVRAFHSAPNKSRSRVHVENWDDLDAGKLMAREVLSPPRSVRARIEKVAAAKASMANSKKVKPAVTVKPAVKEKVDALADKDRAVTIAASDAVTRAVGDLLQGEIDLGKIAGLEEGHRVEVQIVALKPGQTDPDPAAARDQARIYDVRIIDAGWRWVPTPALVFLRGGRRGEGEDVQDDRQKWKPSAAAILTVNYRFREPVDFFTGAWNFLDPGLGIHLVAPDMENDSVEFGLGPSLTLMNGLITTGYGWNLTADEQREYYFIGVDLWELFTQAQKIKTKYTKAPGK